MPHITLLRLLLFCGRGSSIYFACGELAAVARGVRRKMRNFSKFAAKPRSQAKVLHVQFYALYAHLRIRHVIRRSAIKVRVKHEQASASSSDLGISWKVCE